MTDFKVDLHNCDLEPIHIPGQIQSHGFMFVVDDTFTIRFYSDNVTEFIPIDKQNILGKPSAIIEQYFDDIEPDFIKKLIEVNRGSGNEEHFNPYQLKIKCLPFYLIISTSGEYTILEFEPESKELIGDVQKMIGRSISEMLAEKKLETILQNSVTQVKKVIGYDRIMIYRFADDGHGEVVAEAKNDNLESWCGLHYPASDIPKQAREMYKKNLIRLIADVEALPSKITTATENTTPLDLTCTQLRAVSPVHIQYLKNMGVSSSFSISLICKDELWGLIACHSYSPRFINFKSREAAKLIGQILSSALEFRQEEEKHHSSALFKESFKQLTKYLNDYDNITEALAQQPISILNVVDATGAILVYENQITLLGDTPDEPQVKELLKWIKANVDKALFHTKHLSSVYEVATHYQEIGGGMMVSVLSKELEEYIIWFKQERLKTIAWAGDPNTPIIYNGNGMANISPRHSFETWKETVKGTSDEWTVEEINTAVRLKEEIIYAINLKARAIRLLNEKLSLAYEELDTFSYTISHDLKAPITTIKSFAQLLQRAETFGQKEQSMVSRIVDSADKMNAMIKEVLEYSRIGRHEVNYQPIDAGKIIRDIVQDLEPIYSENMNITIGETPAISGDSMMIMQVFSNVISNAVKYSQKSSKSLVHIEGKVDGQAIIYRVSDNGLGIPEAELPKIFDLFNRLSNVGDIEGTGVGLSIVNRIMKKHKGEVSVESELEKGSVFYLSFNR